MYACVYVCIYIFIYIYSVQTVAKDANLCTYMYQCLRACMYMYMYMCRCIYIYIYIYIAYTHINTCTRSLIKTPVTMLLKQHPMANISSSVLISPDSIASEHRYVRPFLDTLGTWDVCVCVCIYIYIYIYIYAHVYIYIYTHAYICF